MSETHKTDAELDLAYERFDAVPKRPALRGLVRLMSGAYRLSSEQRIEEFREREVRLALAVALVEGWAYIVEFQSPEAKADLGGASPHAGAKFALTEKGQRAVDAYLEARL